MGFRTVVVLHNDQASEWKDDPNLGQKIFVGMNFVNDKEANSPANMPYGRVVECVHADQQTLAVIDSYNLQTIASGLWAQGETDPQIQEKLIRAAAAKLGFNLVRQPSAKSRMGWTGSDDVAR